MIIRLSTIKVIKVMRCRALYLSMVLSDTDSLIRSRLALVMSFEGWGEPWGVPCSEGIQGYYLPLPDITATWLVKSYVKLIVFPRLH